MRKVPKKNISSKISDIMSPAEESFGKKNTSDFKPENIAYFSPSVSSVGKSENHKNYSKKFVIFFAVGLAIVTGVFFYYSYAAKYMAMTSVAEELGGFYGLFGDNESIKPGLEENSENSGLVNFGEIFSFFDVLRKNYSSIRGISNEAISMMADLTELENNFLKDATSGNGEKNISRLESIYEKVRVINQKNRNISENEALGAKILPIENGDFFSLKVDLDRAESFLEKLIVWMKEDKEHRMVVFLENPSEIRPGGGFIGSYIDISFSRGNLISMDVRDINDADNLMERKIVPPKPLQLITRRWRAADANWFPGFDESASTIIDMLESSKLYADQNIKFEMAIGLSAVAVGDMLGVVGPVEMSDGAKITQENFLTFLQSSVQSGQAEKSEDPKKILSEFAPLLLKKLVEIPVSSRENLRFALTDWINDRELRFFAKEGDFQEMIGAFGLSGEFYEIPQKYNGDYLAVYQANIGGGKSDFFIQQNVVFQSQILEDGTASNKVMIEREHGADENDPWWYTEDNQVYTRVYTPRSASLTYAEGGSAKTIKSRAEYAVGYENDPRLVAAESTAREHPEYSGIFSHSENEKNVFATWVRTARGDKSSLSLSYSVKLSERPADGRFYQFVFERQSGLSGIYNFEFHAPVGFVFRENNSPIYEYKSDDPSGITTIDLTFKKIDDI